jgi:hypothetical protein
MRKLLFFTLIITTLSSCYMERGIYVHRHPWSGVNRVHRYYVPVPLRIYEAPSRVYRKRGFR